MALKKSFSSAFGPSVPVNYWMVDYVNMSLRQKQVGVALAGFASKADFLSGAAPLEVRSFEWRDSEATAFFGPAKWDGKNPIQLAQEAIRARLEFSDSTVDGDT